jgi:hypothetical protein
LLSREGSKWREAGQRLGVLSPGGDLDLVEAELGHRGAARHHLPDPAPGPQAENGEERRIAGERGQRFAHGPFRRALFSQSLLDLPAVPEDPAALHPRDLLQRRLQDPGAPTVAEGISCGEEKELLGVEVDIPLVTRLDGGEGETRHGGPSRQLLEGFGSARRELDLPLSFRHGGQG